MALDGSDREPPGGWSEEADNVFFSIYSRDGTVRDIGWDGAAPNDPDRQDLLLVDDLSTKSRFDDAAERCAFIRDLHALHPMPRRRTVIYATREPADALEVANRIAVLRRGRIVQCGTPSEIRRATLCYLPPYSPDLNPIELCFAKLKTLVRAARCRSTETLWPFLGACLPHFSPEECRNYFRHCGYPGTTRS